MGTAWFLWRAAPAPSPRSSTPGMSPMPSRSDCERRPLDLATVLVQAPIDGQEVWGAGHLRAQQGGARKSRSRGSFYDWSTGARPNFSSRRRQAVWLDPPADPGPSDTRWCVRSRSWRSSFSQLELVGSRSATTSVPAISRVRTRSIFPRRRFTTPCALGPASPGRACRRSDIDHRDRVPRSGKGHLGGGWSGLPGADRLAGPR